ncbi:methyltransferase [Mycobacterium gordonae]|uniref:Hydroxyneurosporene methyltransferase n=1 Tax=Mycobacterium gordonae TaxID=1778 RepID=A0A1X1VU72_MYCGO|nr:methyltransferase [Mycobacterium gordonae]MCV7010775.1 hydroxyneurosporene methyltransferase [Mycobacterium gordonae]ODR20493.1 hydroxyneurosporene methyltransferase [Mycobacterium gordonae]ORV72558.1 hydroxyneurosporene methyltransferase [Mycobacterium gordonae]
MQPTRVPPVRLVKLVDRLRYSLSRFHQRLAPAPVVMTELILAGWISQAIEAAAELGVADALAAGPLQPDDLAAKVGADPDAVSRLLRALESRGIFRRDPSGAYGLTPLADTLRTDAKGSMAAAAKFYGSPQHREHWSMLAESIRTGRASIPRLRGKEFFDYLGDDPYLAELFNGAMTSISEMAEFPVVAAYDFTRYQTIMDVGGGHGRLLAAILGAAPTARGVLLEIPDVAAGALPLLRKLGVAERVRIETGSFFDGIPAGADLYVLKNIIHDWPDEKAEAILRNVRTTGGADCTVVLVELVIPEHNREFVGKWVDLEMLLGMDGSRERTAEEYRTLLARAGFRMTRVIPTASPFSLVEAKAC